jgi:hypothetical protein
MVGSCLSPETDEPPEESMPPRGSDSRFGPFFPLGGWIFQWSFILLAHLSPSPGTPDFDELSRTGEGRREGFPPYSIEDFNKAKSNANAINAMQEGEGKPDKA